MTPHPESNPQHGGISRRRALALGGGALGGLIAASAPLTGPAYAATAESARYEMQHGKLPADEIQKIVQAEGSVSSGVLSIDLARTDIGNVTGPQGVVFTPAFMVDGTLTFEPLSGGRVLFNGDLGLKPSETNAFIDAILANGQEVQAFHQHFDQSSPDLWFVHWRGIGPALKVARGVHSVLKATGIPLPQKMPKNPKSPLDDKKLGHILGGAAQIGDEGVVMAVVSRKGRILLDGVRASPEANISTNISVRPLNASGSLAAMAPDIAMTAGEIGPVLKTMRAYGWHVGCLYNQETAEQPQLYFSHFVKTGDPYVLAREARKAIVKTNV